MARSPWPLMYRSGLCTRPAGTAAVFSPATRAPWERRCRQFSHHSAGLADQDRQSSDPQPLADPMGRVLRAKVWGSRGAAEKGRLPAQCSLRGCGGEGRLHRKQALGPFLCKFSSGSLRSGPGWWGRCWSAAGKAHIHTILSITQLQGKAFHPGAWVLPSQLS